MTRGIVVHSKKPYYDQFCDKEWIVNNDPVPWYCTLPLGHSEPFHVAQGISGTIYAVWETE